MTYNLFLGGVGGNSRRWMIEAEVKIIRTEFNGNKIFPPLAHE